MAKTRQRPRLARENVTQGLSLCVLLVLLAVVVAGPSGLLAWQENHRLLAQRQQEIRALALRRDEMRNRVNLLDPRHADPDLASELLRRNLNVAHPDEMIMMVR